MTGGQARRLLSSASNAATRKARVWTHREQHHRVGGLEMVLPPGHQLPYFQRRHPTYDAYAEPLLARLAADVDSMLLIDVGANVGDTAVAAMSAAPNIRVLSVEGNAEFCDYWRRNTRPFADRCTLVEGFVGPIVGGYRYADDGSTGRFTPVTAAPRVDDIRWVTPGELLERAAGASRVVWKSDMDGFDIHVLAEHWQRISTQSDVIWFEYDPCTTAGDPRDVERLLEHVDGSGVGLSIYDNLGRRMVTRPVGSSVPTLADLTQWLRQQRRGQVTVPYLDVWAFRSADDLATALSSP
jgi:FkbM family methyltransferase